MNQLEEMKKHTTIVADTGDFESIAIFQPTDATTNPSLILASATNPKYSSLVDEAIQSAQGQKDPLSFALERIFVNFGEAILNIVPGRVSIEVDARDSFDIEKSLQKARRFIQLFEERGFSKDRILIKLASTWEGIQAAKILEKENIHCNLTLLFCLPQAIACAEAGVTLISPFVGRILDWYKKNTAKKEYLPHEDPGVISVKNIFNYYKKFGYKTEIMGASFRNVEEILELTGCDFLTISPNLLNILQNTLEPALRKLDIEEAKNTPIEKIKLNEANFRYLVNADPMASDKLSEGIRRFAQDTEKLEKFILEKLKKAQALESKKEAVLH